MERFDFGEKSDMETKNNNSNDDVNVKLQDLDNKIDNLSRKMKKIENKIDKLLEQDKKNSETDVEVEEDSELEPDYLTGPSMFSTDFSSENPAIRNTALELLRRSIATASEIAKETKKDRAVESLYLNDLASRNKIRKLRIGRKIYFYIGRSREIRPFKNPIIQPDWREILLSIIRALQSFDSNQKLSIKKIVKHYKEFTQPDSETEEDLPEQFQEVIQKEIISLLQDIEKKTTFIKLDLNAQKVEFIVNEWLQLG